MKKVIVAAAMMLNVAAFAFGLGVPPVLAASHSGSASGHSSGHGAGQGAGHRMSATPEPEGSVIPNVATSGTDTPTCPNNPHTLACPQ